MQKESDAEKISGLMKIYKNNVKDHADQVLEKKKKDPETIEELDKHLKYMEKAISQLKKSTAHQQARAKKQIRKQTKDNKDLITELSFLRREDRKRKEDQDEIDKDINKINQEKRRMEGEIEKYKDLMRKMRLQDGSKQTQSAQIYNKPQTAEEQVAENYRRSQSRGKLHKGSLYNRAPIGIYKQ